MILVQLSARSLSAGSELREVVQCDQVSLSRALAKLKAKGHVSVSINPEDRRSSLLAITADGRRAFADFDSAVNRRSEILYSSVSADEARKVFQLWESIANATGLPLLPSRPNEHASRVPIRRFTAATGCVGNDFMEMGVSLQDWHLIESVHALPKSDRSPSSLSRILGVSPAALSYTLDQLEQAGILKRVAKKVGARGCVVQLTSKGEKERARLLGKATEFFAKHLTIPFGEFRQAVDIFSRIMANAKAPKHVKLSPIPFTTTVIPEPAPCCTVKHTTNMSQLARGFMMRQIVSAGIEAYAPASIFESSGQFYELELGGLLIGVAQIREEKAGGNEVELACLIVLKDIATAVIPFLMQSINRELMDAGRVLRFEGTSGVFSNLQESLLSALLASVIQSKGYKANP